METHYVTLSTDRLSEEQAEKLKNITLGTPEDRDIQEEGKETYYKGTLSECEAFISSQHQCLQGILETKKYNS